MSFAACSIIFAQTISQQLLPLGAAVFGQSAFGKAVVAEQIATASHQRAVDGQLAILWAELESEDQQYVAIAPEQETLARRPQQNIGLGTTPPIEFGGAFAKREATLAPFLTSTPGDRLSSPPIAEPLSPDEQGNVQPNALPRVRPTSVPPRPFLTSVASPPVGLAAITDLDLDFNPAMPSAPSPQLRQALQILADTGRPPQFVQLAFDGSLSLEMWEQSLGFSQRVPAKFTYFVSCVYFLSPATKRNYRSPRNSRLGSSAIGFGDSAQGIGQRLTYLRQAVDQGHEVGSHACGHFDGTRWRHDQWQLEFDQFQAAMAKAYEINGIPGKPLDWEQFIGQEIRGFRAPLLGSSQALFDVLRREGFRYDTSRVGRWTDWPTKRFAPLWDFPLVSIPEPASGKSILSMDYNFYLAHSAAKPNPARADEFENRMLDAYLNYFQHNYRGNRAPIHIGHHFSRWNDGAYWRALQRFAMTVCSQPEVICGTYDLLADFMDALPPGQIAVFQASNY